LGVAAQGMRLDVKRLLFCVLFTLHSPLAGYPANHLKESLSHDSQPLGCGVGFVLSGYL